MALVWIVGAAALLLPGQRSLRQDVQRSEVLRRLNEIVPPERLLNALARVDPFPSIAGPPIPAAPSAQIARDPDVRAAAASVVRILGTACGLGISGSGWVAAPGVVVTAAHVVAGERSTSVVDPGSEKRLAAEAVGFDPKNDIAVLRVPGLGARPLAMVEPEPDRLVGIVGYPLNGPLDIEPGRIGKTATRADRRRIRQGPGRPDDHEPLRRDPARELRRPGDRQRGARADDGLRDEDRRARRVRRPGRGRPEGARLGDAGRSTPASCAP